MTITIKNFQSIAQAELNFKGFVVICGKSDIGKSAIRRAVETILFNEWQKGYQRINTKQTEISLSKDGLDIKCVKSSKENRWAINGNEIPKLNKDTPELPLKYSQDMNISTQLEPLFMVAYKDTENTKILNKVFGIDRLETAQYLCSLDLRRQKQILAQNKEALQDKSKDRDNLKQQVEKLKEFVAKLNENKKYKEAIENYIKNSNIYNNVKISYIESERQYNQYQHSLNRLKAIYDSFTAYKSYKTIRTNAKETKEALNNIKSIPNSKPLSNLLALMQYNNLNNQIKANESHSLRQISFMKCKGIKKLFDYLYVKDKESLANQSIKPLREQIEVIEAELSQMICPTCKQPLQVE